MRTPSACGAIRTTLGKTLVRLRFTEHANIGATQAEGGR